MFDYVVYHQGHLETRKVHEYLMGQDYTHDCKSWIDFTLVFLQVENLIFAVITNAANDIRSVTPLEKVITIV